VAPYADRPDILWANGSQSRDGINNRIHEGEHVDGSLYLLYVPALELDSHTLRNWYGREEQKLSGEFQWSGVEYRLSVTDPVVWGEYINRPGRHSVGPAYVTVSLAEAWYSYCYKLIAGVIRLPE